MKYFLLVLLIFSSLNGEDGFPDEKMIEEYKEQETLKIGKSINISVTGQGVAPIFASSPAQAYVLAKRAATAEAYRLIAERVNGVAVEGKDTIKNMSIKASTVKTKVSAMIRDANIVETTFKNGLCEVEMEVEIKYSQFD